MESLYADTDVTPTVTAGDDQSGATEVTAITLTAEDGVHQVFWAAALESGTKGTEDEGVHHMLCAGADDSAGGAVCSAVAEGVHHTVLLLWACWFADADWAGADVNGMPQ